MIPATVPIQAWRIARYVEEFPFTIDLNGVEVPYDLTGWSGALQVRQYGAQAGAAIISLSNVTSDIEGVWIIEPSQGIVRLRIDETTLAAAWTAIGGGNEAGDPAILKCDLVMTPPTGGDEVWTIGDFTLNPGVTV